MLLHSHAWDHSTSIWTSLTAVLPVIWDTGPQTYSIHWSVNTKKGKIKNLWITYQFYHFQSLAQHSISSGIWTSYKIDTHIKDHNMVKTVIEWSYSNWNFTWIENIAPIILKNMSPYKVGHFVWYVLKNIDMSWKRYELKLKNIVLLTRETAANLKWKWNEMW